MEFLISPHEKLAEAVTSKESPGEMCDSWALRVKRTCCLSAFESE
jgi:hypothetical protein